MSYVPLSIECSSRFVLVFSLRLMLCTLHIDSSLHKACTKVLSQSIFGFGFFLYHSTDPDEPYKPVTSVFLIRNTKKVISLLKIDLSAHRSTFIGHKGSTLQ